MRVSGDWPWPIWATIVIVLIVFLLINFFYRKTRGDLTWGQRYLLLALRCVSAAIVLLMLAQWVLVIERVGMPVLAIILDDSMSMQIRNINSASKDREQKADANVPLGSRRWDEAVALLCGGRSPLLSELAEKYRVKVYLLDQYPELQQPIHELPQAIEAIKPERATTPLGGTILQIIEGLRGQPPAGVVILTDGVVNEGPSLEEAARRALQDMIPLYFVGFGAEKGYTDLGLQSLVMEDSVFLGDRVVLQAQLLAKNTNVKEAQVRLTDVTNQRILAEEKISLSGEITDFYLIFKADRPGEIDLRLECLPLAGEVDRHNNSMKRRLVIKEETIRILMVEEVPRFEYRFLRNALIREPNFALTTVLLGADPEYVEEAKGALVVVPTSRDELWSYDVIILGDVAANRLSSNTLEHIAGFVAEKTPPGGLIVISGPQSPPDKYSQTALAKVLPGVVGDPIDERLRANAGPYKLMPTGEGLRMPWIAFASSTGEIERIWQTLPEVYWFRPVVELKPGARVLVESLQKTGSGDRREPVVVFQYVGGGRVLLHTTDETWRWRRVEGLGWYQHYWIEAIRFMARGKLNSAMGPQLFTDRSEYQREDPVKILLECPQPSQLPLRDDGVSLWLEYEGQSRREITLQRHPTRGDLFETTLRGLSPGQYYLWVPTTSGSALATRFVVLPPLKEWEAVCMAKKEMEQAAHLSGGAFYPAAKARQLLDDLPPGRGTLIESLPPQPLWNSPIVLFLLIVTLASEWLLRKRLGLL
ncbi:MAG: hypothetical protein ACUVQH_06255 [Thermogutta sp.]